MISNWLLGDFSRLLNTTNIEVENSKITPQSMSEFLQLIDRGVISGPAAKAVFEEMFCTGQQPATIVAKKELSQITNASEITSMVEKVISENHDAVADYLSGKEQAVTFLVGQAMRATRGRANPQTVRQALIDNLGEIP